MKPVEFKEQNVVFAKDQPEYLPLPAFLNSDGVVTSCWELSEDEIKEIISSRKIWVCQKIFDRVLQPIILSVVKIESELEKPISDELL